MLKVVDVLRLPDRKTLYVINCRNEQFLIASSNDKITLISKLNEKSGYRENELQIEKYLNEKLEDSEFDETNNPYINRETKNKKYVIKSLLKELSDKNQTKREIINGCNFKRFKSRIAASVCNDAVLVSAVCFYVHDLVFKICDSFFNVENRNGHKLRAACYGLNRALHNYDILYNEPCFSKNV